MSELKIDPGLPVYPLTEPLGFEYGAGGFGPKVENRHLGAIRKSLRDPNCEGPDVVYSIAMDVGKQMHKPVLEERMLLFGVVTYAAGRLGQEPIRSQGHIHRVSEHSGWSPPEIYEIWSGKAVIYMQETAQDDPGRCFAVYAEPGDVVVVPPNWAHATISADSDHPLTFGAWCDREYGFEYDDVRAHGGLAWFPLLDEGGSLFWERNEAYLHRELVKKPPADYGFLGIKSGQPIYRQFEEDPERFQFVSKPSLRKAEWNEFTP